MANTQEERVFPVVFDEPCINALSIMSTLMEELKTNERAAALVWLNSKYGEDS